MSELFVHNPKPKKPYSPRRKNDFYPTPYGLALATLEYIKAVHHPHPFMILDTGAGTGVWGQAAYQTFEKYFMCGVELDAKHENNGFYNTWETENYLDWKSNTCYNLIVGNPPYSLAEQFLRKSLSLVNTQRHWVIAFLLPLNFLAGQDRGKNLFAEYPPFEVRVCSRRPSFSGNGKTNASEYGIYIWSDYDEKVSYLGWLDWDYTEEDRRK